MLKPIVCHYGQQLKSNQRTFILRFPGILLGSRHSLILRHICLLLCQIDEPNGFGNTALHVACYMGQEAVATELVNHGANVNQPNKCGYTPLHLAAVSTNGALCLELLVNNGADVNQQVCNELKGLNLLYFLFPSLFLLLIIG